MMTPPPSLPAAPEDRFGQRIAARLGAGAQELPHDIGERLRAAREQALARRKVVAVRTAQEAPAVLGRGAAAVLGGGGSGWWVRVGAVVPLVMLVAGLVAINLAQDDQRTRELAEVDAALLTGDLPPAAYADPGFMQYLKGDDAAVQ